MSNDDTTPPAVSSGDLRDGRAAASPVRRWWGDWLAFGVFATAAASLPATDTATLGLAGRLAFGLALLGAAAAARLWQYRWPRDLADRLTVPAVAHRHRRRPGLAAGR